MGMTEPVVGSSLVGKWKGQRVWWLILFRLSSSLPMQVIFGEEELSQGIVAIKNLELKTQENVKEEELVEELRRRLSAQ